MAVEGKRRCYHSARDGPRCASCRQLIKSFIEEGVKLAAKHVEKYFEGENRDSHPLQRIYPFLYFDRIILRVEEDPLNFSSRSILPSEISLLLVEMATIHENDEI